MITNKTEDSYFTEYVFEKEIMRYCVSLASKSYFHYRSDIEKEMIMEMSTELFSKACPTQKIEYEFERPTFFDWLLRRKRKVTIEAKAKDVLVEPPKVNSPIIRMVEYKIKEPRTND